MADLWYNQAVFDRKGDTMKFLNYESKIMSFLTACTDYILLGLLWVLFSLPVLTFGAATTAMLYTANKSLYQGEGNVFPTFWQAFRREFRQATVLWLSAIPLLLAAGVNLILILQKDVPTALCFVLLPAMVLILGWIHLWFGYLSRFGDSTVVILKNTFRMTVRSFLWVLALLILAGGALALALEILMVAAPLLLVIPGLYIKYADLLFRKAFQKYMPETAVSEAPGA